MKTLTLITCAMLIALSGLLAQHENVILEKVSPEKVPPAVVTSVEKDYPGVIVEQFGLIPAEAYNEHMVSAENTVTIDGFAETMVYLVDVKYEEIKIYAIYDAKGNVIQVREKVKDYIIPVSVVEYIEKEYPGYEVLKEKELVKTKKDGPMDHYVIKIKKEKWVKKLYFNEKGELLKAKDE